MPIRRYEEIMESAVANMVARQNKITDFNEGSIAHTFLDTLSRIAERAYVAIRQGYNEQLSILPYSPFEMEKKAGSLANGTVVFSRDTARSASTVIPKGTLVSGNGLMFATTEAGIINGGQIDSEEVAVSAEKAGNEYNVAAGVVNAIESVVPVDVVAVRNDAALIGGTDEESNAEFEKRFKIFFNGLSGTNVYAVRNAALSVPGVRSVAVQNHKPPYKDVYNMTVYVDDGSGGATQEMLNAVQFAIEGDGSAENPGHVAPGINIRVIAPTAIPVDVNIKATTYSADETEARSEIRDVIAGYINGLTSGESMVVSELITKVMALNYVKDVAVLAPGANIDTQINQIARLGECSITLVEGGR